MKSTPLISASFAGTVDNNPLKRNLAPLLRAPFLLKELILRTFTKTPTTSGRTKYIFATILPINDRPVEEIIAGFRQKFDEVSEFNVAMHKFNSDVDFLSNVDNAKELIEFTKTIN